MGTSGDFDSRSNSSEGITLPTVACNSLAIHFCLCILLRCLGQESGFSHELRDLQHRFFFLTHTELRSLQECLSSHTQAIKHHVGIYPEFSTEVVEKTEGEAVSVPDP